MATSEPEEEAEEEEQPEKRNGLDSWTEDIDDEDQLAYTERRLEQDFHIDFSETDPSGFSRRTLEPYYRDIELELSPYVLEEVSEDEINEPVELEIGEDSNKINFWSEDPHALRTFDNWMENTRLEYLNETAQTCDNINLEMTRSELKAFQDNVKDYFNGERENFMEAEITGPVPRKDEDEYKWAFPDFDPEEDLETGEPRLIKARYEIRDLNGEEAAYSFRQYKNGAYYKLRIMADKPKTQEYLLNVAKDIIQNESENPTVLGEESRD